MTDLLNSEAETIAPPEAPLSRPKQRRGADGPFRILRWGPPIALLLIILTSTTIAHDLLGQRGFLLPRPWDVFGILIDPEQPVSFYDYDQDRWFPFISKVGADIAEALGNSIVVALVGLAIAIAIGVLWAIGMNQAKWVERTLFPYAVILQSIPILAVVPLIGFWFGFDFSARVIVCVLIALFPMVSNTQFGLESVDRGHRELFQLQGASRWTILTRLEMPAALPAIFTGIRTSAGLSVVGAIVGDFFFQRGTLGIGGLIAKYQSRLDSEALFASIIFAALFGVVIFQVFGWLRRRAVGKWYDVG